MPHYEMNNHGLWRIRDLAIGDLPLIVQDTPSLDEEKEEEED